VNFSKGPSIILNSGTVDHVYLSALDKFGRYSLVYVVGIGNRSFRELDRICKELIEKEGMKNPSVPWTVDPKTNMVSIRANCKKDVPVSDIDGKKVSVDKVSNGIFCKINITPSAYSIQETSTYLTPDGVRHLATHNKEGIKLFLNGVKLIDTVSIEEMFT
jgi:hypothetical protein